MPRVAIVTSHPIQYQAPWFRALAREVDVTVFFCHRQTPADQAAAGFGQAFDWDLPLVDGYRHHWLNNVARTPGVNHRAGCDTPGVGLALAEGRFDACIVNGWYLKSYVQAIRACRVLGIPALVRGDSQLSGTSPLLTTAKYLPYRWMLGRIDAHLYVGQRNREYLRYYGVPEDRLFFCPHFVDNERFAAEAERARASGEAERLRCEWSATSRTTVFGFCGKFLPHKRAADFVRALAVLKQRADAVGVLVGSGPDDEALRREAAEAGAPVRFAGFHNQTRMPAVYAALDCLVLPSARETWGLVVNEAMAVGLPAIVSDIVGCGPDLIADGDTGWSYPVGNVDALAERMELMTGLTAEARSRTRAAVLARVARYSCAAAVAGVRHAIDSLQEARVSRPLASGKRHA